MTHTHQLIKYLETFGELSSKDKKIIIDQTYFQKLEIGETFIETGKTAHKIGFIIEGVFRYFFYDREGNEITSFFMMDNQFVTNIISFNELTPSSGTIMAETTCSVIIIDRNSWELLSDSIPAWNSIISAISSNTLLEKTNFQRQIINQDAKSAYLQFVEKYPTVIQRVPLIHIASFLGITKFSLSRIRKKIVAEERLIAK
ncbi:Crp/Fnr family transcriptional regulator [Aquimarina sp. RZ0]|uniref:Crp/Fnr family transcriptional regulator n=1 Tax=Aquimarina sp. RZ0 TaxID=2607730 RepID=UPI0011F125D2|nr:Crp/Fnr family transcriptional regulator [Aquimarina sp. RZ0]KAA1245577.1 Crp/Fnr family transcriptional regulator [Aquimarina sp. RZ0]